MRDGSKTSFIGSVNESKSGWVLNYELLWEDDSEDTVRWVQEEFEALWTHFAAVPLAEFVISDAGRLANRSVILSVDDWIKVEGDTPGPPKPASVFIEAPVYRKQVGLWEHQKYFVATAFDAHLNQPGGARFVLADQVGLGKTVQLAMAAELMALVGTKPVLVLAPKTLLRQWQDELLELLELPSAIWNGRQWIDENGVEYAASGPVGIRKCPRRVGIVSTGLVTAKSEAAEQLKVLTYECIIVDEAHRARRKNLGPGRDSESPDANNLLQFLYDVSKRTKSMLLATATPVQLQPVEAWDLLDALGRGTDAVLGGPWSRWRKAKDGLDLIMGLAPLPSDELDMWEWIRNPLPPRAEHRDFDILRRALDLPDNVAVERGDGWARLRTPDRSRVVSLFSRFVSQHNPFIRHIVRRSRKYLEETRDPETGEPYLKPIGLELFGERDEDAIRLPLYLRDAYELAEAFCKALSSRLAGSGFLRTLLLRRVGSTIAAGRQTAEELLSSWSPADEGDEDDAGEDEIENRPEALSDIRSLTAEERDLLQSFIRALEANQDRDPKYEIVLEFLRNRGWLQRGCIIFSQYFDSISWLAEQLVNDLPTEPLAIYAGSNKSGIWHNGAFSRTSREAIKAMVRKGELRLVLGTDAASEGLNLQRLGTLINLDLPWNPTRLEQRKGRIQRIGQVNDLVYVCNMRYLGSVEDTVHRMLSTRLQNIHALFGQIPDVLEDVWIDVALGEIERAKQVIDAVPRQHPFDIKYQAVSKVDWERCSRVLDNSVRRDALIAGW
jgi:superfamily II DNA or RNA helicase